MKTRLIFLPLLFAIFAFLAFMRTSGAEQVRVVQMVDLIATGLCLGVALAHLVVLVNAKSQP
jgi:hypothetical protein